MAWAVFSCQSCDYPHGCPLSLVIMLCGVTTGPAESDPGSGARVVRRRKRQAGLAAADRKVSLALSFWVINGLLWQRGGPTADKDAAGPAQTCHSRAISIHGSLNAC